MSFSYVYATPFSTNPLHEPWKTSLRYRLEKTPGKAVIMLEPGYWGTYPLWDYEFNPPYHKNGLSVLHLEGRAHFIKGKVLEERYDEQEAINPNPPNVYWENRFRAMDNM